MPETARSAALKVLERCRRDGAFSDSALSGLLGASGLKAADRALVSKLCYGVLQNTILLDFYIDAFCGGKKLEPKLRDILRLSLYQILMLDRIPDHAAVNEAVLLCRRAGLGRASGLVNAVLRRAAASRDKLPEIPRENIPAYLSVKYSTPIALVSELIEEFGGAFTEKLLEANNAPAPLTIQVNTLKTSPEQLLAALAKEGVSAVPHEFLPNALNISASGELSASAAFQNGLFHVQDAAAALAVTAADPGPGQRVLDACAAPGGKSFACAVRMENRGEIVSCDIHENKLKRVVSGAQALGIDIIRTEKCDASKRRRGFENAFDVVLADVPCSGLGVIRKKPDIRYKDISELLRLPEIQLRILENVSAYVKPGGALLYSTCTILRRENADVADAFLNRHREFEPEGFSLPVPAGQAAAGMTTLYPHIHNTDGFFICKMRRARE